MRLIHTFGGRWVQRCHSDRATDCGIVRVAVEAFRDLQKERPFWHLSWWCELNVVAYLMAE